MQDEPEQLSNSVSRWTGLGEEWQPSPQGRCSSSSEALHTHKETSTSEYLCGFSMLLVFTLRQIIWKCLKLLVTQMTTKGSKQKLCRRTMNHSKHAEIKITQRWSSKHKTLLCRLETERRARVSDLIINHLNLREATSHKFTGRLWVHFQTLNLSPWNI